MSKTYPANTCPVCFRKFREHCSHLFTENLEQGCVFGNIVPGITKGEAKLYQWWKFRHSAVQESPCFSVLLYDLIMKADRSNRCLLAKSFPLEVEACSRFREEPEYWTTLKQKIDSFFKE